MSKTLPQNSQAQDVRISVNSKADTQSTSKKPKNQNKTKALLQSKVVPRSLSVFPAVSVTSVWNPASPKAVHNSSGNNPALLLCPAQKVFFQPSTSKANIDVMIYLAIYPINAFTEGRGNSTSSK